MPQNLVIFGTSTTAERLLSQVIQYRLFNVIGFALDKPFIDKPTFKDLPVFDVSCLQTIINKDADLLFVAIAWNRLNRDRKDAYLRLKSAGYRFANIVSPHARVHGRVIGGNCWIGDNVIIETGATIADNVFIDHNAYVGTFSTIDSHCYLGACSLIAGRCRLAEQCFVGVRATLFDEVTVGKKCLIGACTIVKRNLADYSIIKSKPDTGDIIQSNPNDIEGKLVHSHNVR